MKKPRTATNLGVRSGSYRIPSGQAKPVDLRGPGSTRKASKDTTAVRRDVLSRLRES